jgi:hypothetical protein
MRRAIRVFAVAPRPGRRLRWNGSRQAAWRAERRGFVAGRTVDGASGAHRFGFQIVVSGQFTVPVVTIELGPLSAATGPPANALSDPLLPILNG